MPTSKIRRLRLKPRPQNKSHLRGVMLTGNDRGKYMSCIRIDGQRYYLGYFYSPESAHRAYMQAKRNAAKGILPAKKKRKSTQVSLL